MFTLTSDVTTGHFFAYVKSLKIHKQEPSPGERYVIGGNSYLAVSARRHKSKTDDYDYFTIVFSSKFSSSASAGAAVTQVRR